MQIQKCHRSLDDNCTFILLIGVPNSNKIDSLSKIYPLPGNMVGTWQVANQTDAMKSEPQIIHDFRLTATHINGRIVQGGLCCYSHFNNI